MCLGTWPGSLKRGGRVQLRPALTVDWVAVSGRLNAKTERHLDGWPVGLDWLFGRWASLLGGWQLEWLQVSWQLSLTVCPHGALAEISHIH